MIDLFKVKIGELKTCPVCGKSFTVTSDTTAWVKGGYTCSWKCFLKRDAENREKKNGTGKA